MDAVGGWCPFGRIYHRRSARGAARDWNVKGDPQRSIRNLPGHGVDRADMLRLVKDINGAVADDKKVPVPSLEATFGYVWPDLEKRIAAAVALPTGKPAAPKVPESDKFAEVIALLREGQRETAETKAMIRRLEAVVGARATTRFVFSDPTNPEGGPGTLQVGPNGLMFAGTKIRGSADTPLSLRVEQSPPVVTLTDPASGSGAVWGTSGSPD